VPVIDPKTVLIPLNKALEANDRLNNALDATARQWPTLTHPCWIDQLSEPTILLAEHRLGKNRK
jgi:hypothetical protein